MDIYGGLLSNVILQNRHYFIQTLWVLVGELPDKGSRLEAPPECITHLFIIIPGVSIQDLTESLYITFERLAESLTYCPEFCLDQHLRGHWLVSFQEPAD